MISIFDYIKDLVSCQHSFSTNLISDLQDLFIMRSDCYAEQTSGGHWRKIDLELTSKCLQDHVNGIRTIGTYQVNNDRVKWICFDSDDHGNNNSSLKETEDLVQFLLDNDIPYIVEMSGSENSYHVWLFLVETSLQNAYNFSRIIADKSGFKGEAFPKQRNVGYGRFGSLVKIPCCINRRSGNWSKLAIGSKVDSLIKLDDVPDQKKPSKKPVEHVIRPNDLFYCQKSILENKTALTGSEGHFMRVALAANAIKSGYKNEEIIDFYRHQRDFNEAYTLSNIQYIRDKKYYCGCDWLKTRCLGLVRGYCEKCEK